MDELETLGRRYDRIGPPRQEALEAAEARLRDAVRAEHRPVRRRRRMALRFAAAAMGTAVIATALTWSQDEDPARRPVANAAELARQAETRSRSEPVVTVLPQQWAYVRTMMVDRRVTESWTRMDGRRAPGVRRPPAPSAMVLTELPADPGAALARLYAEVDRIKRLPTGRGRVPVYAPGIFGMPRDQAVFRLAVLLCQDYYVPPRAQAALYGALSRLPKVGVLPDATDAAGRHGTALFTTASGVRTELIVDRRSYRYLGGRTIITDDNGTGRPRMTMILTAQLSAALVDRPGERT
ncbi:CU044_5270 family protein [Actinoallomurus sp. CA-150999]|uniref:CU044_5270 family protein n=1 Tax=Actinoallomurus sp. CA-150999 TaxID=3239887 RepID=UPI003D9078DF